MVVCDRRTMAVEAVQVLRTELGPATVVIKLCTTKSQGLMMESQCLLGSRQGFQGEGRAMTALFLLFVLLHM